MMLTCIARLNQSSDDSAAAAATDDLDSKNPSPKSLTSQLKDMALKASGAYRGCGPCGGQGVAPGHVQLDAESDRFRWSYRRQVSSGSSSADQSFKWGSSSREATPRSNTGIGRREPPVAVFVKEEEPKEWVAQVEPGILMDFLSLPAGGNDLKRIRFSRDIFNRFQAQRWWTDNYDKIMELYNVKRLSQQALMTPKSEDEGLNLESMHDSPITPPLCRELSSISGRKTEISSMGTSIGSSSSRDAGHSSKLSISTASELDTEWVEQDDPGVYITIRALPGGKRELRRVRFSRERFGEVHARLWWEENRARVHEQYL